MIGRRTIYFALCVLLWVSVAMAQAIAATASPEAPMKGSDPC